MSDIESQINALRESVEDIAETVATMKEFLIGDKIREPNKPSMLDDHNANTAFRMEMSSLTPSIELNTKFRRSSKKYFGTLVILLAAAILKEIVPMLINWLAVL